MSGLADRRGAEGAGATLNGHGSTGADGGRYKWIALSNTTLSMTMATIDASIVIIAMPAIFRGIGLNPLDPGNISYLLWMIIGYLLVTAVAVVTLGRLGDMYGRVRIYNLGFVVFTLASIALSLDPFYGSSGAMWLIGWRLIQALGGSMLMSNSAAILTDAFPAGKRGMALGVNQIAGISGQFVGLLLGGLLAAVDWRLVFWINVPIGIVGTIWSYKSLREIATTKKARIDWLGNITFGVGLTSILLGVTYILVPYGGSELGYTNPLVILALVLGFVFIGAFIMIERRVSQPMFKLSLFKNREFSVGVSSLFISAIARGGLLFMLVIWLQGIWLPLHGYSIESTPFWAGVYMLPMTVGFLVMGPLSGTLSDKYGQRLFMTLGSVIIAVSFIWMAFMPYNVPYEFLAVAIFLQGFGAGMFVAPNTSMVMCSVPAGNRGVASGMRATVQNVAQSLSMTIYFAILIIALEANIAAIAHTQVHATAALFSVFLGLPPPGIDFSTFAPIFMASLALLFFISAALSLTAGGLSMYKRK